MKPIVFTCCLLALVLSSASADKAGGSLFEALIVAETKFTFTVNDSPLKVARQGITLRAVLTEEKIKEGEDKQTTGPGRAYRSYHLEIAYELDFIDRRDYAAVEFYRGTDLIHRLPLKDSSRSLQTSSGQRYDFNYLAINLEGLPLVLLDSVDRVNFRKSD